MMTSDACVFGMAGMGLISLLLIVALVLGVAALVKYLFFSKKNYSGSARKNARGDHEHHSET
ncbi:MAG TPA: hypothetical protein ENH62_03015 [Marinobacter sp.]|uniref:Oxaloacetate decarboxylase, gamma chain n=2 Tax=root TaxID=1 RepID=A0A831R2Y2_9GAMM|nr:hypothetical protein [Marinobacter antarcticus]HDZ37250.1 hypothetical protein [Marinobacter sp.]HEA51927.1 hypothetical protein [Marinobacter antarcticus]